MRLQITVPDVLGVELKKICERRNISLSDYISIAVRGMPKDETVLQLTSRMPFGKYRDEHVMNVAKADPAYILWADESVTRVRFAPEVIELVRRILE